MSEQKEQHRLGTINRWDAPDGDWAAEYDWTRYRGPDAYPVPDGWVFKDPEGGGWWQHFGEAGVGHHTDDSLLDELQEDDSVPDAYAALEDARGCDAFMSVETANPDEVSMRNPEDEELEWSLKVDGTQVFRRVEPEWSDLMGATAEALHAYHVGELEERLGEFVPSSGRKPDDIRAQEDLQTRKENNASLGDFS